jgi:hypothetical protein
MKPLALTSSGNRSLAELLIWALKLELSTGAIAGWVSPKSGQWLRLLLAWDWRSLWELLDKLYPK